MLLALQVAITFVANEGVLLSSTSGKVLIDALFREYRGYAFPADSLRQAMEAGKAPFDSVDLVLVTHRHGDHFHPQPVTAFLRANPGATLVTSHQVLDSLARFDPARAIPSRQLVPSTMPVGTRRRVTVNGITIDLLGLSHGPGRHSAIEHLAYLVELDGVRIFHIGDAEITPEELAPLRLDTMRVDVALLSTWTITNREKRELVSRWVKPRIVMAIHVGPDSAESRAVREALPGTVVLTRPLERRTVSQAR